MVDGASQRLQHLRPISFILAAFLLLSEWKLPRLLCRWDFAPGGALMLPRPDWATPKGTLSNGRGSLSFAWVLSLDFTPPIDTPDFFLRASSPLQSKNQIRAIRRTIQGSYLVTLTASLVVLRDPMYPLRENSSFRCNYILKATVAPGAHWQRCALRPSVDTQADADKMVTALLNTPIPPPYRRKPAEVVQTDSNMARESLPDLFTRSSSIKFFYHIHRWDKRSYFWLIQPRANCSLWGIGVVLK